MAWNWQEALSIKYSREEILKDLLKEQSLLFEMAREDVAKILQKTNYNYIVRKLHYNEIYALGLEVTKKQIEKILERKKGFLFCKDTNCTFENLTLVRKIVQRIANNIKNLFDERYETCIKENLKAKYIENNEEGSYDDCLTMMILEEEAEEISSRKTKEHKSYIEYMQDIIKVDSNGQTLLSFC